MSPSARALLQIHFCVLLWGFTAIIGRTITMPALPLVWWRMVLVTAALMLIPQFWKGLAGLKPSLAAIYFGIGVIVAMHWLTFYGAIKLANASVAANAMALTPLFIAFLEPIVARRRFDSRELFFGLAVIPGMVLVVGGIPAQMRTGLLVGVISALFAAAFGTLNKRYIEHGAALSITGIEMAAGAICLPILGAAMPSERLFVVPNRHDAVLLLTLALGCTLLPYALSLVALRHLSAFTTALAINMEPVYAIVLAIVLLGEQRELGLMFYAGVAIMFAVVFSHPILTRPRAPSI